MVEVSDLERQPGEHRSDQFQQDGPASYAHHFDLRTELLEMLDVLRIGACVAQAEEMDLVVSGQSPDQVVRTQFVTFLQRIRHARKDHQQSHPFSNFL